MPITKEKVEAAAAAFLGDNELAVVIRCGAMGAYGKRSGKQGHWVGAYWGNEEAVSHVVDVTGAI